VPDPCEEAFGVLANVILSEREFQADLDGHALVA
jgi:hypothetical protein